MSGESASIKMKSEFVKKQIIMVFSTVDITPATTPMVYICATMWHETEPEMVQMLTSIFRLDSDQMTLMNNQQNTPTKVLCSEAYIFEAHIFFDDAMEPHEEADESYDVNGFVKTFVNAIGTAANAAHENAIVVPPPVKYPTPYGGRLEWDMPGGNKLKVHLKDKVKVRNKKRWSQVMSMYYHLIYQASSSHTSEHTFLLHVDGDVVFKPEAFHILLDLMNKDDKLGAVCGRTHPTGRGPIVWCQMFEYALSHWMQKATEDVLGCVLCCPGCFSLLRGSALLQVLDRFTAVPSRPKHYLLEDQGEDRWLCSLLIQSGWRVKYAASSDCWTMAPEKLPEFFKQRRRWTPSGFFHTVDLISHWRNFTKRNDRMSLVYIIYQSFMFLISLLAGSVILLVLSGALQIVSQGVLPLHYSVLLNLIPVIIMGVACFIGSSKLQINIARVLTSVYALLQLAMLGFSIYTAYTDGLCSPPAIFLIAISCSVLLAGILHPRECFYIICAFSYYLFAPCMYLVMMIYSLSNLHVISWGTREVKTPKKKKCSESATNQALPTSVQQTRTDDKARADIDKKLYDSKSPKWVQNADVGNGPIAHLSDSEQAFFKNQLATHLYPLASDPSKQEAISRDLKTLRNKTVLVYYLMNAIFLGIVLALQVYSDQLSLPWPCETSPTVPPLGVITIFMVFVGLCLNLVGMMVHRLVSLKRECSRRNVLPGSKVRGGEDLGGTTGVYSTQQVSWISTECLINSSIIQPNLTEDMSKGTGASTHL